MTQNNNLPLVIEPAELEPFLGNDNLLIIDLCSPQVYQKLHVPGAIHIPVQHLTAGEQPATGKLPSLEQLETLFSQIGYSKDKHIVVYDDEGGGWAGRFIWTLDAIGHKQYSYLNGGLHAWVKEKHPVQQTVNQPEATKVSLSVDSSVIASCEYILANLNSEQVKIWDARSPEEFSGERVLAMKGGHIPGAINFEWTLAMHPERNYRIREGLDKVLADLGFNPEQEVITHCQTHHRSGFTYLVAKVLEYKNIKAYDGSWSEWGNLPHTPVEQ